MKYLSPRTSGAMPAITRRNQLSHRFWAHYLLLAFTFGLASSPAYSQNTDYLNSVRAPFKEQTRTVNELDITREYLERTLEESKFSLEIPEPALRRSSDRFRVREFTFHRLVEYPKFGITRKRVQKLAEKLRAKYMKEDEKLTKGFTINNLEELATYLESLQSEKRTRDLNEADLQKMVALVERQIASQGMSYSDLEEIAQTITRYYHRKGLFLAQVEIPAQEISDGVVALVVREGILGRIYVSDNEHYRRGQITLPFEKHMRTLASYDKVEESLYLLNDYPGLKITGQFSPSKKPGEIVLNLNVIEEKKWRARLRADNHGSGFTSQNRLFASLDLFSPLGLGDQLELDLLQSIAPAASTFGNINYSIPLGPRTRVRTSYEQSIFSFDEENPDIQEVGAENFTGHTYIFGVAMDRKLKRSRYFNLTGQIGFEDSEAKVGEGSVFTPPEEEFEHSRAGYIGLAGDLLGENIGTLNTAQLALKFGERLENSADEDEINFTLLKAETQSLFFIPLPFTESQSRFILTTRSQYTENALPSYEQMILGGAAGVRGFAPELATTDLGAILNTEWYFDLPFKLDDYLQLALISDHAYGEINNGSNRNNSWVHLSSVGVLFKLNWSDNFTARLTASSPIGIESSDPDFDDEQDSLQLFADFTYFFN